MTVYLQAVAGALIAAVLGVVLSRQSKDAQLMLGLAVCCMILVTAVNYLEPVMDLVKKLEQISGLDSDLVTAMVKAVGIGLIGEIAARICADAGNAAVGKAVEFLTAGTVLWLCVPMMTALLELVQKMVGDL